MFCSKCGNQVLDNAAVCPSCGNQMNAAPVVTAPMSQMPVYTAPVAPVPQKKNTGMVIGIVVVSIIAVAAIVFAVLFATGTISINKDETTTVSENENGGKPVIKEPEIGSISDLPVVTGDKLAERIMLKIKSSQMDGGEAIWFAADYTNQSEPKIYFEMEMDYENGETATAQYAVVPGEYIYCTIDIMPEETYKIKINPESDEDPTALYGLFFGRYDKDNSKFKYLGKEYVATDSVYVYERISEDGEKTNKMWIDGETGCCVKSEVDGKITFEVSEIITGDDVEFPEFDFENAVPME